MTECIVHDRVHRTVELAMPTPDKWDWCYDGDDERRIIIPEIMGANAETFTASRTLESWLNCQPETTKNCSRI